jgi:hypothetical protein
MGGNALKSIQTVRIDRPTFDDLSNRIKLILAPHFSQVEIPTFYRNKESFGDIDFVVSTEGFKGDFRELIVSLFNPTEIYHNGNCWSFDFENVQIDFITTSKQGFTPMLTYMCGSDAGNLIGKIAHSFGLKYGQKGLSLDYYFKEMNIGEITISTNHHKIFEFLGLSFDKFKEGFDDLEDIFKFVSSSPYFTWENVQHENNNRVNRERDKKRKTYASFLEWIDKNVRDDNHRFISEKDKTKYFKDIENFFPESDLKLKRLELEYGYIKSQLVRTKFSGEDVMQLTGLTGKELGECMSKFKSYVGAIPLLYDTFILENTKQYIIGVFKDFYYEVYRNEMS